MRSGRINIGTGRLNYSGQYGYWWSALASAYNSSADANSSRLYFDATDIIPSSNGYHYYLYSFTYLKAAE